MLKGESLYFSYQQKNSHVKAISNISLEIPDNTTCAIIGPSGCGKTTLLYLLGGLLQPEQGKVLIDGKSPVECNRDIALILQEYGLLPWKTVRENVSLGLKFRGFKVVNYKKMVEDILNELEISEVIDKYPSQLSGGQRQRVAIARALTLQPKFLFMDEPFSSLDALTREQIQNLFLELWNKYQMTVVFVTHSIEEAVFLGQKIIILSSVPGQVLTTIENNHFAREDWRQSKSFYSQCQRVRSLLKAGHSNEK